MFLLMNPKLTVLDTRYLGLEISLYIVKHGGGSTMMWAFGVEFLVSLDGFIMKNQPGWV